MEQLNPGTIRTLISPKGAQDSIVQTLNVREYQKVLVRLTQIKRILEDEAPLLLSQSGFSKAMGLIGDCDKGAQYQVLSYPTAGYWTDVAHNLIERRAHRLFPELHLKSHLQDFWRFGLAVAYISGNHHLTCQLMTDMSGCIFLPGTGKYLKLSNPGAYRLLNVTLSPEGLIEIQTEADKREAFEVLEIPYGFGKIELNGLDKDLCLGGRTGFLFEIVDEASRIKWTAALEQAFEWIEECNPNLASEIFLSTKAILPVLSESSETHISATFREAPGLMALSWTSDTSMLTEAIVHEHHHQKLNALLNFELLISGPTREPIYYSPWRPDPRPLLGILHGAFVFQAVLEFWKQFFERDLPILHRERLIQRAHQIAHQVEFALKTLTREAELTTSGKVLIEEISRNLTKSKKQLPEIQQSIETQLQQRQDEHFRRWQAANKHLETLDDHKKSNGESLAKDTWLARLGLTTSDMRMPVADLRGASDPVLETLLDLVEPDSVPQVNIEDIELKSDAHPVQVLAAGHLAYIWGDYSVALDYYGRCLQSHPDNIRLWEYFGFTLRHTGKLEMGKRVLTNLNALLIHKDLLAGFITVGERPADGICNYIEIYAR